MKPGVGVGIIILNQENEVLLLLRNSNASMADSDMRLEGTYTLPSGKVNFGETFEEACIRKVKEESNLDIESSNLKLISIANDLNEYAHFATLGFIASHYKGNFKLKDSGEFVNYGWFKMNDLPANTCLPTLKIINNYLNNRIYSKD